MALTASDLRDQRDRLIDSALEAQPSARQSASNGSVGVFLENALVVDGSNAKATQRVRRASGRYGCGSSIMRPAAEGSVMGELVSTLTTRIPGVQARLDDLAEPSSSRRTPCRPPASRRMSAAGVNFFDPDAYERPEHHGRRDGGNDRHQRQCARSRTTTGSRSPVRCDADEAVTEHDRAWGSGRRRRPGCWGTSPPSEHYRTTVAELAVEHESGRRFSHRCSGTLGRTDRDTRRRASAAFRPMRSL